MDLDFPGAKLLPIQQNSSRQAGVVVVVGEHHGELPLQIGLHPALLLLSALQPDSDGITHGKVCIAFHGNGHFIVQRQDCQRAMLQHYILDGIPFPGIEVLHPATGLCGDGGGGFVIPGIGDLL